MMTLDKSLISTRVNESQYIKGSLNSTNAEKIVPESTIAQQLRIQRNKAKATTKSASSYFNASLKRTREERLLRANGPQVIKFANWKWLIKRESKRIPVFSDSQK